ncbi:MAG: alginate export family protein, partial [Bacteroidota bacterium]
LLIMNDQKIRLYLYRPGILIFFLCLVLGAYGQDENLAKKIGEGEFTFDGRLRYWYANNESLKASTAFTFGSNFGYLTKTYKGFQIYVEGESVVAITPDLFFDGINGLTDRTNITDVETLELNKLRISYTDTLRDATTLQFKVGRQAAIVEDERFIGNVNARQDDQTFDAIMAKIHNQEKGLSFEYAYMYQINRLIAQVGDWRSDSHAFRLAYDKNKKARLGLFVHLLDFQDDAPALSNQTYGLTIDRGQVPRDRTALTYKAAFAYQSEYGDNPVAYDAFLLNAELGVSIPKAGTFSIGYELAGSDDGAASYQFPLSTGQRLHRISDTFVNPPADGLHNPYFTAETGNIIWGIGGWLGYHAYFSEIESTMLGQEIDIVLYKPIIPGLLTFEFTYSSFFAEDEAYNDLDIFSLDLVFKL